MSERPLILISNDDGVDSRGIRTLTAALEDLGEVLVVAPSREQSAMSHAISLDRPLRTEKVRDNAWAIDGTPVDCVYLALLHLCPRRPSLVISGINHGFNLGADVFYSGTVAGAVEGAIRGFPAVAMSMGRPSQTPGSSTPELDFSAAGQFAHALGRAVLEKGLPPQTLLNVNVPPGELMGYQWTRLGRRVYRDQVEVRTDLRGRHYFWIGGPEIGSGDIPGSDCYAVERQAASITPLELDLTSHHLLEQLPGWQVAGFDRVLGEETPGKIDPGPKEP